MRRDCAAAMRIWPIHDAAMRRCRAGSGNCRAGSSSCCRRSSSQRWRPMHFIKWRGSRCCSARRSSAGVHEVARCPDDACANVDPLLRRASEISNHRRFVIAGSLVACGAVVHPPVDMVMSRGLDFYSQLGPGRGFEEIARQLDLSRGGRTPCGRLPGCAKPERAWIGLTRPAVHCYSPSTRRRAYASIKPIGCMPPKAQTPMHAQVPYCDTRKRRLESRHATVTHRRSKTREDIPLRG